MLTTADIPVPGNLEERRKSMLAAAREEHAETLQELQSQLDQIRQQAEGVRNVPETERSRAQAARLKAYERQIAELEEQLAAHKETEAGLEAAVEAATKSTGREATALAVSDQHLYLCVRASSGYDVIRCDWDYQNARQVLSGLRGCCGQMDIQARGDRLVVAENTKFLVAFHDADGQRLNSFGSRSRTGGEGFGSCCNPMNVRCCPNGDVLTAESSIGDVKRFNADGKLLAYIGRAKISGGCKHVAVDWDPRRDRYYMMNVSDSTICALWPKAEAPEFTPEELEAKAAQEGLGRKLVGVWTRPGQPAPAPVRPRSGLSRALTALLGGSGSDGDADETGRDSSQVFDAATFGADGRLDFRGGIYGQLASQDSWGWRATRQDPDRRMVEFEVLYDGSELQNVRAVFVGDNQLELSLLNAGTVIATTRFVRSGQPQAPERSGSPSPEPSTSSSAGER